MIQGYPEQPSVFPGLHIASDEPVWVQICFCWHEEVLEFKARTAAIFAEARPLGAPDRDWDWPVYEYTIPTDWQSGAYIAMFVPLDGDTDDRVGFGQPEEATLFVVKNRKTNAKILFKL